MMGRSARLRLRASVAAAAAAVLSPVAVGLTAAPAGAATPPATCRVTYVKTWDAEGLFGASITIENLAPRITSWRLTFTWPGDQRVLNGWYAVWSQSGPDVTAVSLPHNSVLEQGVKVTMGFNGAYTGANPYPTGFALNGTTCVGPGDPAPSP